MKTKSKDEKADELRSEYDLAALLKEGVRGKYAKRYEQGTNIALRLVMQLKRIPGNGKRRAAKA